jgi:choline-glycine betaine transporter
VVALVQLRGNGEIEMTGTPAGVGQRASGLNGVNIPVFVLTGGFIVLFCALALVSLDTLSAVVDAGFAWSAKYFGLYWQLLLLSTFFIAALRSVRRQGEDGRP